MQLALGTLTRPLLEILRIQQENFSEGELSDINDVSGCDTKDEDVPEETMPAKNFT